MKITATAFMQQVFASHTAAERPAIGIQYQRGIPCFAWPETEIINHTHYSVGMVSYPQEEGFHRRNTLWTGSALLVLDDIYEKAKPPAVEPTFRMETKPGSEQWGYVFTEPMRDASDFETLVESCIVAGLGDPGAKGRIRLARLPGSQPVGKKHPARLANADWNNRFQPDVQQLLLQLGIPRIDKTIHAYTPETLGFDPGVDPVLNWFFENRLLLGQPMAGNWWPVECPFVEEHTNHDPSGTRYHARTKEDAKRAFKCHHGHCAKRHFAEFAEAFEKIGCPSLFGQAQMYGAGVLQQLREHIMKGGNPAKFWEARNAGS